MQRSEVLSSVSKAAANAFKDAFTGIKINRVPGYGSTKPIGTSVTSIYSSLFTFRSFVDGEARATCAAFSAPVNAAAILHSQGLLVPVMTPDDFLRQFGLKDTADRVKRAFGPLQKEMGRVVAAPPPQEGKPEEGEAQAAEGEKKEEPEQKKEEEGAAPKEEAPAPAAAAPAPEAEEESLVPDLDFAEVVQQVDMMLPILRESIHDATEAIRGAKLVEKSEEHENKRNEMLKVLQTERERLDAVLKAACEEVERSAEEAAAAIKSKYEQRVKNAEKKVEAADEAILADANETPLAMKDEAKPEEKKQPEPQPKQEPEEPKEEEKKSAEEKPAEEKQEEEKKEPTEEKKEGEGK